MAGVEHAYQYTVEVKSRFSLFLDDSLNNEDPDILISKLQHSRTKKEKPIPKSEPKQLEPVREVKPKDVNKVQDTKPLIVASPVSQPPEQQPESETAPVQPAPAPRARGEGPNRFRGRGRAGYFYQDGVTEPTGDVQVYGAFPPEHRGRFRGRGRSFRGRGYAYTDYREFHGQAFERNQPKSGFHGDGHATEQSGVEDAEPAAEPVVNTEVPNDTAETPAKGEDAEEEQKTYTLEEYKAMRSSSRPVVTLTTKGTRKANDGKDVFKNMVEHRKVSDFPEDKENEVEHVEKVPPPEDKYEINVTFTDRLNDRERIGRGFGGRGFGRGRGGRGRGGPGLRSGFRGDRGRGYNRGAHPEHQAAPIIHSDQDFPSLK